MAKGTHITLDQRDTILIEIKKGEQKLFMIMFTTKKTIKRLILELNRRLVNQGNEIHIDDVDSIIKSLKK